MRKVKNNVNLNARSKAEKITRKCIACGEIQPKAGLLRIVRNKEGDVFVDPTGRANGRGAYVCKSKECLKKAVSSKALNRSFKCEIDKDVTDDLLNLEF